MSVGEPRRRAQEGLHMKSGHIIVALQGWAVHSVTFRRGTLSGRGEARGRLWHGEPCSDGDGACSDIVFFSWLPRVRGPRRRQWPPTVGRRSSPSMVSMAASLHGVAHGKVIMAAYGAACQRAGRHDHWVCCSHRICEREQPTWLRCSQYLSTHHTARHAYDVRDGASACSECVED